MLLPSLFAAAPVVNLPFHANYVARQTNDFNWTSITPTPNLVYHPCYGNFKCARLQVPIDWSSPVSGNSTADGTVAIGIVTLPATVPSTDPSFGGSVLVNPGGPNGAGTSFVLGLGDKLQNAVDGERHYEILGFDPRGVDKTTPSIDCYSGDEFGRAIESYQTRGIGRIAEGPDGMRDRYELNKATNQLCEQTLPELLKHISTASVARDMVEIVDRVEQERSKATNVSTHGLPKLQYMGFSYGSVLGMTFASMFPERVGRLMIDGIVDIDDYKSASWKENLNDFEAVVDDFYEQCFVSNCVLKQAEDTVSNDIRKRIGSLLAEFDAKSVPLTLNNQVTLLTSEDVRNLILEAMYAPLDNGPNLAEGLAGAISGNLTLIAGKYLPDLTPDQVPSSTPYTWQRDVRNAVTFADGPHDAGNRSLEYYKDNVAYLIDQAPTAGAQAWSDITASHIGRTIRPKYSFNGPYTMLEANANDPHAPAAPLLILSARRDPVTPLQNAYKMSKLFPGSSVLVQESSGHCALFSSDSECTNKVLREYFATGKLPAEGATCEADCKPFAGCKEKDGVPTQRRVNYTPHF